VHRVPDSYLRMAFGLSFGAALINGGLGGSGWLSLLFYAVAAAACIVGFHRDGFGRRKAAGSSTRRD